VYPILQLCSVQKVLRNVMIFFNLKRVFATHIHIPLKFFSVFDKRNLKIDAPALLPIHILQILTTRKILNISKIIALLFIKKSVECKKDYGEKMSHRILF